MPLLCVHNSSHFSSPCITNIVALDIFFVYFCLLFLLFFYPFALYAHTHTISFKRERAARRMFLSLGVRKCLQFETQGIFSNYCYNVITITTALAHFCLPPSTLLLKVCIWLYYFQLSRRRPATAARCLLQQCP